MRHDPILDERGFVIASNLEVPGAVTVTWLHPGDAGFDDARRVYNDAHQAHPCAIAQVGTAADVAEALTLARASGLPLAVRGGGHSIGGLGGLNGGLVIDLRRMNAVVRTSGPGEHWVGGGSLAGDVAEALAVDGLVLPLGDNPTVGIGGITLGGGIGWLTRSIGLTADRLVAAEVVTADGSVHVVDAGRGPDIFWALRGGGGGLGVVTRFRFRAHPLPEVIGGTMVQRLTADLLRRFVETVMAAPRQLGVIALAMCAPEFDGRPILSVSLVWSGEASEGRRVIAALRALSRPLREDIYQRPYRDMYRLADAAPASVTNATETLFADRLDDPAIHAIVDAAHATSDGALSAIELRVLGGALADVPVTATAFAHRRRRLLISAVRAGYPVDQYAEHRAWVESVDRSLTHIRRGRYLNFVERPAPAATHPGSTGRRLAAIRRRHDPTGLFGRGNHDH